ncbi:tetratricopeptide repeat protein [Spirillospora sp. NBC_00431]
MLRITGIWSVRAVIKLWILKAETNDWRAAREAYLRAVDLNARRGSFKDNSVAAKSLSLGTGIAVSRRELVQPARLAFRRSIASEDPEFASLAAIGLAGLEMQNVEETYGADNTGAHIAALQFVIGAGHPDYVPFAAKWLAFLSNQTGDIDTARTALSAAMASGDLKYACQAASDVGELFQRKGLTAEAIAALRFVVDNDQPGAVVAAQNLGELLVERGDIEGARAAYRFVLDRSTSPRVVDAVRAALDRL